MGRKPLLLIFQGSAREGGNTETLCEISARSAREFGMHTEIIHLKKLKILPCKGCFSCSGKGICMSNKDDINKILAKMKKANAFIFATPVYFWNVSGLMKMFFDRLLPLLKFVKEGERMRIKSRVEGKNCAIIVVQEEERSGKISIPLLFFKRNLEDFGLKMIGKLFVYGALLPGDVNKNKNAIKRAYLLGRRIAQYAQ